MIVGASPEPDAHILKLTEAIYKKYNMKRVYFSSYIPMNTKTNLLPTLPVGLLREHRLYQADWLIRFYGFRVDEILSEGENLPMEYDPKCHWALSHPELFPVEINTAPVEMLARIPGIGLRSAYKIISARRYSRLDLESLKKMKIPLKRAIHFITFNGKFIGQSSETKVKLLLSSSENNYTQLSMFSSSEIHGSVLTGEL
jgi:predicted DNA-binding helix-hairpin-helix protein